MGRLEEAVRRGAALAVAAAIAPLSEPAHADDAGLTPAATAALGEAFDPTPEEALPIGGFLVYPSVFVGAVYNSNVSRTPTGRQNALGLRVSPSLTAVDDQGLHKTTI